MTTLELRKQSARKLDTQKRKLEASIIPKVERIFKNMADDASNLYKATNNVPTQELAVNYEPEFLKEIRDAMRKSIREFGFNLRKTIEKKHGLFFDAELKSKWIELDLKQSITIQDDDIDDKLEQINNDFLIESTTFVANESEAQNDYVTETNTKMLEAAVVAGIAAFSARIATLQNEAQDLTVRLVDASLSQRASIVRQIERVNRQIEASNRNQRAIVAENIRTNLLEKAPARSELIAAQNVGLAESWARQTEAELVDDANLISAQGQPINVVKSWQAILDSRTRPSHVDADNQEVGVSQNFVVGGETLRYPRDPNGSAGNIINCRCISDFDAQAGETRSAQLQLNTKAISDIDLKPTESMAKEAKRGLEWRDEFNRGGTRVGVARARDLSNRKNLSPDTVRRMVSYFARHEVDKEAEGFRPGEDGYPSNGRIAWALWGGDPGKSWANKKWEQIKRERDK